MTRFRILAALGLAVLDIAPVLAQQATPRPLTLEEALTLARPASEAIGIAAAAARRADADHRQARSGLFPQLTASASYERLLKSQFSSFGEGNGSGEPAPEDCEAFTPDPTLPIDQRLGALEQSLRCVSRANPFSNLGSLPFGRANTWRWGLSASQTLFAGGRVVSGIRVAEAGRRAASVGLEAAEAETVLEVITAYADAALAEQLADIARDALAQADSTLAQTALRREVGTVPEFDLLRATVARDNLRPQVIQAEARREVARERLRQLLNLPAGLAISLATPLDDSSFTATPTLAALLVRAPDTAAASRATVRQADAAVDAQAALRQVARGDLLPALSVSSAYGQVAYPGNALPAWNEFYTNWNLTVGLQLPLFTGGRLRAASQAARASLEEAELRRQQALEGAALDARQALATRDAAQATWMASAGTVEQAARAYAIAEVRFQEGISTQTELLDARVALQQAQATRAAATRDLLVARVRLALLAALPLPGAPTPAVAGSAPRSAATPAPTPTGFSFP